MTEYGVEAALQWASGTAGAIDTAYKSSNADTGCASTQGGALVGANAAFQKCVRKGAQNDGGNAWLTTALTTYNPSTPAVPGSLGAIPLDGDWNFEFSEPRNAHVAGDDNSYCHLEYVVTAYGMTKPSGGTVTSQYAGEGIEIARARVVSGAATMSASCGGK
jgi:hypothetical protein